VIGFGVLVLFHDFMCSACGCGMDVDVWDCHSGCGMFCMYSGGSGVFIIWERDEFVSSMVWKDTDAENLKWSRLMVLCEKE
jgi:hypothetical protein